MLIKDILKENNIELDLPNEILNMKFKGKFIFTEIVLKKYFSIIDPPKELENARTMSWKFHNFVTGNSIYITPCHLSNILTFRFTNYVRKINSKNHIVSGAIHFDNHGKMSMIHPHIDDREILHEI